MDKSASLHLRCAGPSDAELVLAFVRELAEYEHLLDKVTATTTDIEEALSGNPASVECLLAEVNGVPIGFALFFHNFSTFTGRKGLYLEDLYIRAEYRGRGYGRKMLAHLAGIALKRGCPRFEWVVLDWNFSAIGFYESLGAEQIRNWRITRLSGEPLRRLASETESND